jgi:predicted dehydrogenase
MHTKLSGPLRVGAIGAGRWSRSFHLPLFHDGKEAKVVAVWSRREESARELAEQFSVERVFSSYEELIAQPDIDAVAIATPPALHHPIALAAIRAGKHVYCEKPLGVSAEQARELWEAAQHAGVTVMVGYTQRFIPALALAKEILASGELGEVYHVNATSYADYGWQETISIAPWRFDRSLAGSGALGDMGSHIIDRLLWWIGDIVAVCGVTKRFHAYHLVPGDEARYPVTNEDVAQVLARFATGAPGTITLSRIAAKSVVNQITEVHCAKGSLVYDSDPESLLVRKVGQDAERVRTEGAPRPPQERRRIICETVRRLFLQGIEQGKSPSPNLRDGVRVQLVMEAVEDSAEHRNWVTVPVLTERAEK